jgi:hypothetical protein
MQLSRHQTALLIMGVGAYFIVIGLTAKSLISESDIPATEDERANAKATPRKRLLVALVGTALILWGFYSLVKR